MSIQTKKITLSAMFLAIGIILPFFYRTGTSDWKYVASNAFSGIFMWNDLRSTVWFSNRFYSADFSIFSIRHADDVSDGSRNGF